MQNACSGKFQFYINTPEIHAAAGDNLDVLEKTFTSEPLQGKVRELQMAPALMLFWCLNPLYKVYLAHTF